MSRIKVIELINQIHEGGAETLVKDYALYLDSNIFDVTILTEFPLSVKSANVRVLLKNKKNVKAPFGVTRERVIDKLLRKIRKIFIPVSLQDKYRRWYVRYQIKKIKPDIIHAHLNMLHYLAEVSDVLKNTKLFYTCHSLPYRYFNDEERKEELIAARYLIEHNGLRLIGLHETMKNELNTMFNVDTSLVVNNCVHLSRFQNISESKAEIRASIGIPIDAFVVGHVGRFVPLKNQPFLVNVFYEVLKKKPNSYLLLVGDGDTKESIDRLETYGIKNRCIILSHRSDIPQLLKAMDVFIFPSQFEGLGIACIEAQAVGLRCVISDTVPCEIFFSEKAVPLSLSDDVERWADVVLEDKIKGNRQNDIMNFSTSSVIKQLEKIYCM